MFHYKIVFKEVKRYNREEDVVTQYGNTRIVHISMANDTSSPIPVFHRQFGRKNKAEIVSVDRVKEILI